VGLISFSHGLQPVLSGPFSLGLSGLVFQRGT